MSRCLLGGLACSVLVLGGGLNSGEPLRSGPQVGAKNDRRGFVPKWVAGPCAGARLSPVASGTDLVALVFVREQSDSLTGLVKKIDAEMQRAVNRTPRPLGAYVIFMKDAPGLDESLRTLAEKEAIKQVALGIGAAPPDHAIAPEADVTVVVYSPGQRLEQKVVANVALRKGELDYLRVDEIVRAIAGVLPPEIVAVVPTSRDKEQEWRYTFTRPAGHWFMPDFNDLSWKTGPGGFGNKGTPNSVDRTPWHTSEIWLRREIILPDRSFARLQLRVHADDYADIYLNGVLAARVTKCTPNYLEFPISAEARKTLRPGANVLAVTCRDTGGGRYIDVGLVEALEKPGA